MATEAERIVRLRSKHGTQNEGDVADIVSLLSQRNYSSALQNVADTTRVLIAGSSLLIPKFQAGMQIRWRLSMTKTAAGTAASTFDIGVGRAAAAASATARVAFTKPAGTAVVDEALVEVLCTVRSVGASGVLVGQFQLCHNLAATGHATIPCVVVNTISAGFANNTEDNYIGLYVTAGASDDLTFQLVQVEASYVGTAA